jgi:hypothetical protein
VPKEYEIRSQKCNREIWFFYAANRKKMAKVNCHVINQTLGYEGEGSEGYIASRILNFNTIIPLREEPLVSTERRAGGVYNRS